MAYTKYSLTPADNNAAPPNGAPEGMLPSAVNDTMRDMMSQIRDVGDGIRTGVYTLTAPVITGGSINGTTVGASTASTGRFSTLDVVGLLSNTGGILFGGNDASMGTGEIKYVTGNGLTIYSKTGSTNDFSLLGAAGNGIMRIPTGTVNLNFPQAGVTFNAFGIGVGESSPSSGTGITFPATQSASSSANTLDDYEEGAWTPTLTYSGGNGDLSYVVNEGTYTKIGNMVLFTCRLQFGETTASGYIEQINGLPFTLNARSGGGMFVDNMTGLVGAGQWQAIANTTVIYPSFSGTGGASVIFNTNTGAASNVIVISGVYRTA